MCFVLFMCCVRVAYVFVVHVLYVVYMLCMSRGCTNRHCECAMHCCECDDQQDRILESGPELSRLMLKGGAYIYVCGDGNAMAQGVHRTLVQVLVEHGGMASEADAEDCLKAMKTRNRYVLDVWS